jgi:hypothetical protein
LLIPSVNFSEFAFLIIKSTDMEVLISSFQAVDGVCLLLMHVFKRGEWYFFIQYFRKSNFAVLLLGFEKLGLEIDNCKRRQKGSEWSQNGRTKSTILMYGQTPLYVLSAIRIFNLRTIFLFHCNISNTYQNFVIRTLLNVIAISFFKLCLTYFT